ncbi:glycosyltransferase family 4 protein [Aquiflexum lacus]|uniref:glycosyltransferase family 4 protein n=1 Tax=Aquiflexum lacus TaxID=2483805 RepID=UPI0018943237|nr:glycosyltransferase family 4 protein [Aquiflexum lacus]
MKVLFVSSGNKRNGLNPIIQLQAKSIEEKGVEIEHFLIFGSGIKGYFSNIFKLRKHLKKHSYDLIHAHFGFSCIVAQLAKGKLPLLVTLMGTDVLGRKDLKGKMSLGSKIILWINHFFGIYIYDAVIVMNRKMKDMFLKRKGPTYILSNGVDTTLFQEIPKAEALNYLGWDPNLNHFLFMANPNRPEKNYPLVHDAIKILKEKGRPVKLHAVFQEKSENLKYYFSAATALLIPSYHEGSPNVVKEAFACNCPIVFTDVGDVAETTADLEGCFMAPYDPEGFSKEIIKAIEFRKNKLRIKGRERIKKLDFDKEVVAEKIKQIYIQLYLDN